MNKKKIIEKISSLAEQGKSIEQILLELEQSSSNRIENKLSNIGAGELVPMFERIREEVADFNNRLQKISPQYEVKIYIRKER